MKRFPIMGDSRRGEDGRMKQIPPTLIPWSVAEIVYRGYMATYPGEKQTLERIAERGGFGRDEVLTYLSHPSLADDA